MTRGLQILALVLAVFAGGMTLRAYRMQGASPQSKRSMRASGLVSLAIIVGTAPAIFFPAATWLRVSAAVVSIAIALLAMMLMWRAKAAINPTR
jgi:hypothetical protein